MRNFLSGKRVNTKMRWRRWTLLLLMMFQPIQAQPGFDAASIRPVADTELRTRSGMGEKSPGTFFAENMSLELLIQEAYGASPEQSWILQSMTGYARASWQSVRILNAPEWVKSDRFDITAKSAATTSTTARSQAQMLNDQKEMDLMLRSLLEGRFALKVHRETRRLPIYELVVSKPGLLKQKDCADKCRNSDFGQKGTDLVIDGELMNMTELAGTISLVLDQPVIDRTGVAGTFDVHLRWTPEPGELGDPGGNSLENNSGSIFTVLTEQLGLKLQRTTGPVEVLVIDHVEKPSPN